MLELSILVIAIADMILNIKYFYEVVELYMKNIYLSTRRMNIRIPEYKMKKVFIPIKNWNKLIKKIGLKPNHSKNYPKTIKTMGAINFQGKNFIFWFISSNKSNRKCILNHILIYDPNPRILCINLSLKLFRSICRYNYV